MMTPTVAQNSLKRELQSSLSQGSLRRNYRIRDDSKPDTVQIDAVF